MGIGTFQSWVLASASISGLICRDPWASGVREEVRHEGAHWPRSPRSPPSTFPGIHALRAAA